MGSIRNELRRLRDLIPPDPHERGADGMRLVRILIPGDVHDEPVRLMTRAEARERGRLWLPDSPGCGYVGPPDDDFDD